MTTKAIERQKAKIEEERKKKEEQKRKEEQLKDVQSQARKRALDKPVSLLSKSSESLKKNKIQTLSGSPKIIFFYIMCE